MIPSIRLNDETAKIYGRRVLLPGTAEYAAFMAPKDEPKPEPKKPEPKAEPRPDPKPETEEPIAPDVAHEVREDGSWSVTRDGELFAEGEGEESLKGVLEAAANPENPPMVGEKPGAKFDGISVPKLRVLASKHGISYAGLKRRALIRALLDKGV